MMMALKVVHQHLLYLLDTTPTSTVNTVQTNSGNNTNGDTYVLCFARCNRFSKFGTYTGQGQNDTNGPVIYCGFKPALIFYIKKQGNGTGQNWTIVDNKREPNNVMGKLLHPDLTNAESDKTGSTAINIDFL